MKKRFWFMTVLISVIFLLTGCYNYRVEMSVNKDKSVDFSMNLDIDMTEVMDGFGGDEDSDDEIDDEFDFNGDMNIDSATGFDDETLKRLQDRGYTTKSTEDGYKYSVSITKRFDNIDDISSKEEIKVNLDEISTEGFKDVFFTAKNGLFKTTYSAYFVFDMTTEEDVDMSSYLDKFNVTYKVNLPSKSSKNNATSEDGKSLNWDMEFGKVNEVIYEFSMINMTHIIILISGFVFAIAVMIVIKYSRKNISEEGK